MTLTPWRTFVTVCSAGTLSAAAQQLGYTQSAVSRQIATLERECGVALLVREARGVRPSVAGAALLPHARIVVAEAERARRAATPGQPARQLIIGAVPSAAVALVPAALAATSANAEWTMLTGLTPALVGRVAAGELDLAVVTDSPPGLPDADGIEYRHLRDDPMAVTMPATHRLAHRRRVRITELADDVWVEDNPGSQALLHRLAARHDVTPIVDHGTDDLMTKIALVAAGRGVALVPRSLGPALRPDVRLVDIEGAPTRGVYVAMPPGRDDLDHIIASLRT